MNKLVFFALAVVVYGFAMHARVGVELADDGAFFLRYAENMLKGQFWVWNLGEAPVWGASAPFYPVLVAIPLAFGVSGATALTGTGIIVGAFSLAAMATLLVSRFGLAAGFAFLAFSSLDTGMMYFSGAGLESPLTFAVLVMGAWVLLTDQKAWLIGLAAGFLMVHKLDLVPAGGLLLLAIWIRDGRRPTQAILIAAAMAAAWYGFAWWYFGAPVPNSFLTKSLHQNDNPSSLTWRWFGTFVLTVGVHGWLVAFSLLAVCLRRVRSLTIYLAGLLLVHLIAYTIKYPFEPYNWYCMPAVFALTTLGAIGLQSATDFAVRHAPKGRTVLAAGLPLIVLAALVYSYVGPELQGTANIKNFLENQEFDRSQAGRWVNENTPKAYVVYTMWGNPALYSQRKVLDGSFLNRPFEAADMIKTYSPEIIIMQNNPGSTPMAPVFAVTHDGYKVVKVFDRSYAHGMDYFFAVLAREDVVDKVSDVELPEDLMRYVRKAELGDYNGILKAYDQRTLFVHPGRTTTTHFEFDTAGYRRDRSQNTLTIDAMMAPNVPEDAVKRGGGTATLTILNHGKVIADATIKVGTPFRYLLTIGDDDNIEFIVGNNSVADTNWLLVAMK